MAAEFLYVSENTGATLEVEADFSVYIQRYPTREQQAEYWARTGGVATDLEGEPSDVETTTDAEENETGEPASDTATRRPTPRMRSTTATRRRRPTPMPMPMPPAAPGSRSRSDRR